MRSFVYIALFIAPLLPSLAAARPTPQPSAAELHLREMEDDFSVPKRSLLSDISARIKL